MKEKLNRQKMKIRIKEREFYPFFDIEDGKGAGKEIELSKEKVEWITMIMQEFFNIQMFLRQKRDNAPLNLDYSIIKYGKLLKKAKK